MKWIIQYDCPDDVETYIHRVGRTARFSASGKAVLFLDESELHFLELLKKHNVELKKIRPDESKMQDIKQTVQQICLKNEEVKHLAQRALICFVKNVHKQKNKQIFDCSKINIKQLALSFGLVQTPIVFGKTLEES